jgi:uncharacterized membrane protein
MSDSALMIVLRLLHVLGGVFWVGGAVVVAAFLMPTMRAIGPDGRPFMAHMTQRMKFPLWMMTGSILTVLSGITLYWRDSKGFGSEWMHSPSGRTFAIGGALAILSLILGMAINSPTAKRIGAVAAAVQAAGGPPSPEQTAELERLQRKLYLASLESALLLLLATAAMAAAWYVG